MIRIPWILISFFLTISLLASPATAADKSEEWEQWVRESSEGSVVFIAVKATFPNGLTDTFTGSGVIVHPEGYVLTCDHVLPKEKQGYKSVTVTGSVGGRYENPLPLGVIRREEQLDLALLKLPQRAGGWRSVEFSAQVKNGSQIVALGFPLNENLLGVPGSITGTDGKGGRLVTNAAINHGMSGGPVFDRNGALVAIAAAGHEEAQGLNLLIPISFAKVLLEMVNSPLHLSAPGRAEKAQMIRARIAEGAEGIKSISRIMNSGAPLFAASASMERELLAFLKDVPAERRMDALDNVENIRRASTLAWRDPDASELASKVVDSEQSLGAPILTGDWQILKHAIDLLSDINSESFSPKTFSLILSPEALKLTVEKWDVPKLSPEELSRNLARSTQSLSATLFIVRYEKATRMLEDFATIFVANAAKLSDTVVLEHSNAKEPEGDTRTELMRKMLASFEKDFDKDSYERLVALVKGVETAISRERAKQALSDLEKEKSSPQQHQREEVVYSIFLCLKRAGVQDSTLDLFIAIHDGNVEMVSKALKSGASTLVTDSSIIQTYQAIGVRECPGAYLEYEELKGQSRNP